MNRFKSRILIVIAGSLSKLRRIIIITITIIANLINNT